VLIRARRIMYIEFGREYLGKVGINHESTRLILTSSSEKIFFLISFDLFDFFKFYEVTVRLY